MLHIDPERNRGIIESTLYIAAKLGAVLLSISVFLQMFFANGLIHLAQQGVRRLNLGCIFWICGNKLMFTQVSFHHIRDNRSAIKRLMPKIFVLTKCSFCF